MSERRRILYVHHRPELGGAPTSLFYFLRTLDPDQWEAHVYSPPGPATELFESAGAQVHPGPVAGFTHIWASTYQGRRWLLFARELAQLPGHIHRFRRVLREGKFDLVHLNDAPLVAAAWMARRAGLPVVWHLRSALPEGGDLRSRLMRRAIRRLAQTSIAINEDVAAAYQVGSVVIPNSVDLTIFHPDDEHVPRDPPVVAFFGFLYPSKGFREFLTAAAELRARGIQATFRVVGGAVRGERFFRTPLGLGLEFLGLVRNYEAEAKALVTSLGLERSVEFIPFTPSTAELYRSADVVVAPSTGPELGRPVIEGAASGVPVVASGSKTGAGILLDGETGLLVTSATSIQLADAVGSLLEQDGVRQRMGRAARAHAEKHFDPLRNAELTLDVYRRVLARGRTPVLFVHHRPQLGGAPTSLAHLIRHLDKRYEPHVFCPPGAAADLFRSAGAEVHEGRVAIFAHAWDSPYAGLRWLILGREVLNLPPHAWELDHLLRTHRFPIIHLNDAPMLPAAALARHHGAKVVWHLRSALAGDGTDRRSRVIARLIDRWGDAAIAIDSDVAERFPIKTPVSIVHNSVEPSSAASDAAAARRALEIPEDRVAIGFAGFVRRQKGWPELVRAARFLVDQGDPVHFVIIGGGVRSPEYFRTAKGRALQLLDLVADEESAIQRLVARTGLSGYFTFIPFTSRTEEIFSALDILTFPNQGVGLGRPVLEAAAYGKPVVASGSSDGAGVLLPEETGILVPEPTPKAIAAALHRLVESPELRHRFGQAAALHAASHFDPERNAAAIVEVYDRLLGIQPTSARTKAA
ncbi:MAG TPA: glycosyltransferase family 4 protein [Gaiellaceae bacterium]